MVSAPLLDTRHRFIDPVCRTFDGASVYPRGSGQIDPRFGDRQRDTGQNHPSVIAEPSRANELITARLKDALALIDGRVLDHLIIIGSDAVSFAEKGDS